MPPISEGAGAYVYDHTGKNIASATPNMELTFKISQHPVDNQVTTHYTLLDNQQNHMLMLNASDNLKLTECMHASIAKHKQICWHQSTVISFPKTLLWITKLSMLRQLSDQ